LEQPNLIRKHPNPVSRKKQNRSHSGYAAPKPTIDDLLDSKKRLTRASSDFLKLDVATALTFAGIAVSSEDPIKKARNQRAARKAYDTVLHLIGRVELTDSDAETLKQNLERLKSELRKLGEEV
jgi:hypothetical protein